MKTLIKQPCQFSKRCIIVLTLACLILFTTFQSYAGNSWSSKKDFAGSARPNAVGFMIANKAYVGTGTSSDGFGTGTKDFWEWDPSTNSWTQKADFGGGNRTNAVGFAIGNKGYVGTGCYSFKNGKNNCFNDFWQYDPSNNTWTQKTNYSGGIVANAVGFSINDKGYVGTGGYYFNTYQYKKDFYEYDPSSDSWSQKADFGGNARYQAVGFSIANKGYIGTGYNGSSTKDFWEYDLSSDKWTQKADYAGGIRNGAVGFSIGSRGYIGTGSDDIYLNPYSDFYEYSQVSNSWTKKTSYGQALCYAVGFSNCTKGYICTGVSSSSQAYSNFMEYTPSATPGAYFTASKNDFCIGECISFTDNSTNAPTSWNWTFQGGSPGSSSAQSPSKVCYSTAGTYIVTLVANNSQCPSTTSSSITVESLPTISISPNNPSICNGDSVVLTANGADSYAWSPGTGLNTTNVGTVIASPTNSTLYQVTGTTVVGCSSTAKVTVSVKPAPPIPVISANGMVLSSNSATGNQWFENGTAISGATAQQYTITHFGSYTVCVTNGNGCSSCSSPFTYSGIEESLFQKNIKIFPNPNNGKFSLYLDQIDPKTEITVFDLLGKMIYSKVLTGEITSIDLSSYPKGAYILELKNSNGIFNKKIVIE